MRTVKIVADSAANVTALAAVDFAVVPLKIVTETTEFIDTPSLNIADMVGYFDHYKGTSKTSCPSPADFLEAFGEADDVFCVTITSGLSGSYNAACVAKDMYEAEHVGARVQVIDTLSAGAEMQLIVERLAQLIEEGCSYDAIVADIAAYQQQTGLLFMLGSLKNFAANGRVPMAVAKAAGILGLRVVGKASEKGTLEPLDKCRGEKRALERIVMHMKAAGFIGGKVCVAHSGNETAADELKRCITDRWHDAAVTVTACRGLCSYYAEKGGLLVGFEKG